ncbi:uncharacterized protein LOC113324750 [Papaver somniferum]|uniref:uncharacterized protein LOC113324750 n=1 Tax=Papaver somniferum TaxID=3469 RepID=UPI000E6F9BE3|nr:uncharacterized protein LOC113324750 [Papaver somniferum]
MAMGDKPMRLIAHANSDWLSATEKRLDSDIAARTTCSVSGYKSDSDADVNRIRYLIKRFFSQRRVDILCIQKTKWAGATVEEVNSIGFRIWLAGESTLNNGVGILINKNLADKVVEVRRQGDRLILIRLMIRKVALNFISVYAPHERTLEDDKKYFWDAFDGSVSSVPPSEKFYIGGDFNGHVGASGRGYERVHGALATGTRTRVVKIS